MLFLSIYDPFIPSGPGNHLRYLSEALVALGCGVHILLSGEETKIVKVNGVTLHYFKVSLINGGFFFSLVTIGKITQIINQYQIDIVHGQSPSSFGYALFSKKTIPFVVTAHGTSFGEMHSNAVLLSNLKLRTLTDFLVVQPLTAILTFIEYNFANKVIVVSQSMAEEVQAFYRIPEEKITVIYNGVNCCVEKNDGARNHSILFVGRLVWRKGISYLINALPAIIEKYPDAKLYIVGSGEERESLEALVMTLNIQAYVTFLGFISDEQLHELYKKIDVYVQPSLYEPLGIAIMEAMRYGKPVIASKTGGIPELITHNKHGLLVEPANSQQLSEAIINVFSSQQKSRYYGDQAQKKINTYFTWARIAEKTLEFYQKVVSANNQDLEF